MCCGPTAPLNCTNCWSFAGAGQPNGTEGSSPTRWSPRCCPRDRRSFAFIIGANGPRIIAATQPVPIPSGTRLGPYEILSAIGAGGMGEVYRARDPKLSRDVAIKVLPSDVNARPNALARFEREAKAVA